MDILLLLLVIILLAEVSFLVLRSLGGAITGPARGSVMVDTSALMDGRIVTAAQTGFIPQRIVIPKSVVAELQLLADQADAEKRSRARRGLDAIAELQDIPELSVRILDDGPLTRGGVDERLVTLAKKYHGSICTIDFNLNKAATVQGIKVLNINELAGNIRMAFLPGETLSMVLTQKGQSSGQAVGYLKDGTMVVVDKAAGLIGQTVEIEFIRSLQTAAGRMLFAKPTKPVEQPRPALEGRGRSSVESKPAVGRRPTSRKQVAAEPVALAQSNDPTEKNAKAARPSRPSKSTADRTTAEEPNKTNRRRRTKQSAREDSLIELVNNQDLN